MFQQLCYDCFGTKAQEKRKKKCVVNEKIVQISKTTQNAYTEHAASIYLAVALHNKKHTPKIITTKRISSMDPNKRASDFNCTHFIKACYQAKVHSKQTMTIENGR